MKYLFLPLAFMLTMTTASAPLPTAKVYWDYDPVALPTLVSAEVAVTLSTVDLRTGGVPLYSASTTPDSGTTGFSAASLWPVGVAIAPGTYRFWARVWNGWVWSDWSVPAEVTVSKPPTPSGVRCK